MIMMQTAHQICVYVIENIFQNLKTKKQINVFEQKHGSMNGFDKTTLIAEILKLNNRADITS